MITCTKQFPDFPFAHRQPNHSGHCALIHGHNWTFEVTFRAKELDANGFVIDFGRLGFLKAYLADKFDHTLVLNADDPLLGKITGLLEPQLARIIVVPNCGAEGLAAFLLEDLDNLLHHRTAGRVGVLRVTVYEDSKNSASASHV